MVERGEVGRGAARNRSFNSPIRDDADVLKVGKLVGAQAIVLGEVHQWERTEGEQVSRVSLALRMIDVESGFVLF